MSYGKSSDDTMRGEKVGSGSDFWNPPDGESRIRLMPPATEDQEDFWFKTGTHFNVGPDERSVPCPAASSVRESCFLCRIGKRLSKGDEDEKEEAESMGARPRYLVSIVDYSDPEAGVQVWPCPVTIFRQLKKFRLNEDEYGDMTDLERGYDIIIDRSGSGIGTKYDATPARKDSVFPPKALLEHRVDSVAEMYEQLRDEKLELPDLAEVQNFLDDGEMEGIYTGVSGGRPPTESSEDGDDEPEEGEEAEEDAGDSNGAVGTEEEKPRSRRSRRSEEPDDESDDAKPEEKASRRRSRASKDEKDESEGEPPKRKRRSESRDDKSDKSDKSGRSRLRGRVDDLK